MALARATEGRSSIARAANRRMKSSGDMTRCVVPSHQVMSPLELMQRLAALVPRPRLHLIGLVSA